MEKERLTPSIWHNAVVRVWEGEPTEGGKLLGTAFLIHTSHLLSAKHVIIGNNGEYRPNLYLTGSPWTGIRRVKTCLPHDDPKIDVAIIIIEETGSADPENVPKLIELKGKLKNCDKVTLFGFSTKDKDIETPELTIQSYDDQANAYVLLPFIARGLSGGPALIGHNFIGLTWARNTDQQKTYISPVSAFRDFINSNTPIEILSSSSSVLSLTNERPDSKDDSSLNIEDNCFKIATEYGISAQYNELKNLRYGTGINSHSKLYNGFWHNHIHKPPLPIMPSAQEFIDSIRSHINFFSPEDKVLLFLQLNVQDNALDPEVNISESEVALPDYSWQDRIRHYASRSSSQYDVLNTDENTIRVKCNRVLLNLTRLITNLPLAPSKSSPNKIVLPKKSEQLLNKAKKEAQEIIHRIVKEDYGENYIETIHREVSNIALTYNWTPPQKVMETTLPLWDELYPQLQSNKHPKMIKGLLTLAGQVQGILSYATLDLDANEYSLIYATSCLKLAELAGSNHLKAWACGTLSLIYRFDNLYEEALEISIRGLKTTTKGQLRSRLYSAAAESAANLHMSQDTLKYLESSDNECSKESSKDSLDLPGIFKFPVAKVHYYAGSALLELDNNNDIAEKAAQESKKAIKLFSDTSPDRSYPDMLVAQVHLARARLRLHDLDGVAEALYPLLRAPIESRTSWHRKFLNRIAKTANTEPYATSNVSKKITDIVNQFERM